MVRAFGASLWHQPLVPVGTRGWDQRLVPEAGTRGWRPRLAPETGTGGGHQRLAHRLGWGVGASVCSEYSKTLRASGFQGLGGVFGASQWHRPLVPGCGARLWCEPGWHQRPAQLPCSSPPLKPFSPRKPQSLRTLRNYKRPNPPAQPECRTLLHASGDSLWCQPRAPASGASFWCQPLVPASAHTRGSHPRLGGGWVGRLWGLCLV